MSSFEIKPAPGTWKWPQGVTGWMIWDGDRQVAWFSEREEADAVAKFLGACKMNRLEDFSITVKA